MQNQNRLESLSAVVRALEAGRHAEALATIGAMLAVEVAEDRAYQLWVEERERIHGSSGWAPAQLRAQFEACSPLGEEDCPF